MIIVSRIYLLGLVVSFLLFSFNTSYAHKPYEVGSKIADFALKGVDGKTYSLNYMPDAKGYIIVFTCNHCPYAKAYEDRIIELDNKFKSQGYPVIAINPNDPALEPTDNYEAMQVRAQEKKFPFPYLLDEGQKVYPLFGAERTPHIFVVEKVNKDFFVRYIGAIDDNYKDAQQVKKTYVVDAVDALLAKKQPPVTFTKAIGCSIKTARK